MFLVITSGYDFGRMFSAIAGKISESVSSRANALGGKTAQNVDRELEVARSLIFSVF
jgi:hypothetical protein